MPIDFRLLDPNAVMKGAEGTNKILQEYARKKAGALASQGDNQGAVNSLYASGDLEGGAAFENHMTANAAAINKVSTEERQRQMEMVTDTANVLQDVRRKQGDAAVLPAFQQLIPLFKHHGATDEQLQPILEGLQKDPGKYLDTIQSYAQSHGPAFTLGQGQTRYRGSVPIAHAPASRRYVNTAAGGQLSEVNPDVDPTTAGDSPDNPIPVESDEDYAAIPSGKHFIAPDGHVRVKQ